jgi:hypothetical protein
MEIRSANSSGSDLDNRVRRLLDLGRELYQPEPYFYRASRMLSLKCILVFTVSCRSEASCRLHALTLDLVSTARPPFSDNFPADGEKVRIINARTRRFSHCVGLLVD